MPLSARKMFIGLGLQRRRKPSASFVPPVSNPPVNTVAPVVTGTAKRGQTLSTTNGTWTNSPTSFTYQWFQGGTTPISGAMASSYLLTLGDVGLNITCNVTAINADGSATAASNSVGPVVDLAPPVNTAAPVVSGIPIESYVLSCTQGTWSNSPTSYTYQWNRAGVAIGGAISATYTCVLADAASTLTCTVTAINADGSVSTTSNIIGPIESLTSLWRPATAANCLLNLDTKITASLVFDGVTFHTSSWSDADSRGITLVQATDANMPLYETGDPLGPALRFPSGSRHSLTTAYSGLTGAQYMCFAVADLNSTAQTGARLFSLPTAVADNSSINGVAALVKTSSNGIRAIFNSVNSTTSSVTFDTPAIISSRIDGAPSINSSANGTGSSNTTVAAPSFAPTRLVVGTQGLGGGTMSETTYWVGRCWCILLFNLALSTTERQKAEGYLAWRFWGATNPLSGAHPWKNRPPPG